MIDEAVVASAEEHFVAALLEAEVTKRRIGFDGDLRLRLTQASLAAAAENATALHAAEIVAATANDLGVRIAFFKGIVTGAMFYADPATRPTTDVDIFFDPAHLDRMGDFAEALGAPAGTKAAVDAMVSEGRVFELTIPVAGTEVDLHRDPINMVLPSRAEVHRWASTIEVTLANSMTVHTLDLEWTMIQALIHGFRDNFADLLHIHDLALVFDADPDWDRIAAIADDEGWTDLIRYATAFVCDVLDRPSPLPRQVSRGALLAIRAVWPRPLLLHGATSISASHRRQSALSLLARGRTLELVGAYGRRALPPRSVIDARSQPTDSAYPIALYLWRMDQRRTNLATKRSTSTNEAL